MKEGRKKHERQIHDLIKDIGKWFPKIYICLRHLYTCLICVLQSHRYIHPVILIKHNDYETYILYEQAHLHLQNAEHQAASGQVNVAFTWILMLSNAYQFCFSNVSVLQHFTVHALNMSTIRDFVYLGLQY